MIQMNVKNISIIFKFLSLGVVIMAAVFWTGAEVETRSKDNDEQTMIGGAIWTQIVLTIGLIISTVVDDHIQPFVEGYFLFTAMLLLIVTGLILIKIEFKKMRRRQQIPSADQVISTERSSSHHVRPNTVDRTYLAIGALCLLSGVFTLVDFIFLSLSYTLF
ncbi:PREDICTED: uncharacterized protein LOC106124898 [Papilio xuthus]|uniref:Uncharacterized protein LOC106124898 n=1 Tax=Papilio xuthus TaxID=66420 RepID=A0AAJ6ZQX4_PAPXU|nr:PREDICTED: uncharacterized protein LOC106124898 [Papilio xuthus]